MYFSSGQAPSSGRKFRRWTIAAGALFFGAAGLLTAPAFAEDAPAAATCTDFGGSASYYIIDSSHIQIDQIDIGVATDYVGDNYSLAGQSWTNTGTVDENASIVAAADPNDKTAVLEYTGTATFNLRITKASALICTDTLVLGETDPTDASTTVPATTSVPPTMPSTTSTSTTMKATTTTVKATTTTVKPTSTTMKSTPTTKAGGTTTTTCKPGTTSTSTTMKPTTTTSTTIPATTTTTSVTPTTIASVPTTVLATTTTTTAPVDETVDETADTEPFPDDSAGIPPSAVETPEVLGETITPSTDNSTDATDQSLAFTGANTRKDLGFGALLLGIGACMVTVASYRRERNAN